MTPQNLSAYLKEYPCQGFNPVANYFPVGDYVSYFARGLRCLTKRVDDFLDLYFAFDNNQLVGFTIRGVQYLLSKAVAMGLATDTSQFRVLTFLRQATWLIDDETGEFDTEQCAAYRLLEQFTHVECAICPRIVPT